MTLTIRRLAGCLAGLALASAAGAAAADTVRVTIAEYSQKTGPYFEELARAFEAENPDDQVELEVVPWDVLRQKLDTDIAAGTNADLAIIGTRWLIDFVDADLIEPLDAMLPAGLKERFVPAFLTPSVMGEQTYALPVAASARAMYVNTDLLKRAGVAATPETWDEVVAAARKIKALGGGVAGFGLQGKEIETDVYFYYALWSYGGEIVEGGKSGLASDAAKRAAALYSSMIKDGLTEEGVTAYNREDVQNLFKQGRIGMMISAPFLAAQIKEEAPGLKYTVVPVPAGTTRATYGVTDSIVLFKNAEAPETALRFLDFMFRDEWRETFDVGEGFLPVTAAVAARPAFRDNPDLKAFTATLPTARFAPVIPGWEEIAEVTGAGLQGIYLGEAEPDAALGEIAGQVDAILER